MKKKLFTLLLAIVAGLTVQAQTTVEWNTAPSFQPETDLLPAFKATLTTDNAYTVDIRAFSTADGEMFDFFKIKGIVGQMYIPTFENYEFSHATLPDGTEFDVTQEITQNMELYLYYNPMYEIDYVVMNTKGETLISKTLPEVYGTTITKLPADLDQSLFYDYSEINFVVDGYKTIEVTATMKKNPLVAFNEDESGEIIYNKLILKGSNYLYYVDDYPNVGLATECPEDETAEWAFVGNPYDGFKIKNHAASNEFVLGSEDPTQDGRTGGDTYALLNEEGSQPYENWTLRPSNSYTNGFFIFNDDGKALHMRDGKVAYWTNGYDAGSTFMAERVLTTEQLLEEAQKQLEELTAGANEVQIGYPNADALAAFKSAIETAAGDIAGGVVDERTICDALKAAIAEVKSPANAVYTPRTDVYYTINNARGSMVYDPAHAEDMDADGNEFLWYANELNKDDANHQWGFIEQNGVYYMYNVGKVQFAGVTTNNPQVEGKYFYANGAWMFSNAPSTVTLDAGTDDWVPTPKVRVQATSAVTGDTYAMSVSPSYTGPVITYDAKNDGSIPMVFAVAKTEQDSEVTEAIKELLSDPAPFRQALEVAIATANERLSKLPDYPIGDGLNEYTLSGNPEAVTAAIEAAQTVLANENATQEELSAALATLNNASDELSLSLNMPKAGMWLRFTAAAHGTMLSAKPVESRANRMAFIDEADGSTVFYFDGSTLTSLDRGLAVTGRDAGKAGVEGVAYWFEESVLTPGKYCIRFNPDGSSNRFLWAWDPSKGYADQNRVDNANCAFIIEDVKELPLTMPYQDGDKYFAAISLPTSVAEVNGANVQNVFMKDGKAIYEPAGTKGISANTGVLLMGGNQVVTLVLGDCNEAPSNNALLPLEKSWYDFTEGLVLGQPEDKIGFWEPEIWYAIDEEGGEIETKPARGFNAYLSFEMAGSNGVELVKKVNSGLLLNAENFPDANFRAALASILGISEGDEITEAKIAATTELDVSSKQIADLTGIEHFTALTDLECYNNQLTSLDMSKNTALKYLFCSDNQLTALDVSNNTALQTLYCYGNQLTSLDMSNNTALTYLSCYNNQLTLLDVSKNTTLTYLYCYNNPLTTLDVSQNTALTDLYCHNNQLTALDVSQNTALTSLACSGNQLTALDVSKNIKLCYLYCDNNQLTSLDVSKNTKLWYLWCHSNQIKGEAMDALVASLPTVTSGEFIVIDTKDENEGNICTKAQVAVAKGKGWKVYDYNGGNYPYPEYEGSEDPVEDIDPVDEDDNIDFGSDMDENDDLNGNVIGDIFYNIGNGNGEYNAEEGCIVLKKTTDDETVDGLSGKDIFGEDFKGQFTGIVFKVPAGRGSVKVTAETTGNMLLKVKIGDGDPVEMELNGKLKISFPYNVSETTLVAIYAGANNEAKGFGTTNEAEDAALKIYGIEFIRDETTAIDNSQFTIDNSADSWYTIDGVKLNGEPKKKGIYIRNGKKVVK